MTGDVSQFEELPPGTTVWQHCLGTGVAPNPLYYNTFTRTLRKILVRPPRRILELGCSAGKLGEYIRELYPDVHHTGIEIHAEAAALARTRLARVIEARIEDIDFDAEGIPPGSIDTFIAGDVLEHLYDPWRALARVLPLLTDDAQVAVSVPNVRNLGLLAELHDAGTWRYTPAGLLDITHIRFFAIRDVFRMLDETGYRVAQVETHLDARYEEIYRANRGKSPINLQVGRIRLENLAEPELLEYCSLQFVVLAHPKPRAANDPAAA